MAISDIADMRPTSARKGPLCEVCAKLAELIDAEADALRALLANPEWRYSELSEVLRSREGIDIPKFSLARHARGDCAAREKLR